MKIKKHALFLVFCLSVVLAVTQIIIANKTVAGGQKVKEMEAEIDKLANENNNLIINIAKESSLENITKKSISLGFTSNPSYVFISSSFPIAFNSNK